MECKVKTQIVNTTLGTFMKFLWLGVYSTGTEIWTTKTDGSKHLTKPQVFQLEKTGLVKFEYTDTSISVKSFVNISKVDYVGDAPPYTKIIVEYQD
jgi:hypothetical protein